MKPKIACCQLEILETYGERIGLVLLPLLIDDVKHGLLFETWFGRLRHDLIDDHFLCIFRAKFYGERVFVNFSQKLVHV